MPVSCDINVCFFWILFLQISAKLTETFSTFEQLLSNHSRCIPQMPVIARLLGERRICKLTVEMSLGHYTVYCLEQELLAEALAIIIPTVCPVFFNAVQCCYVDVSIAA